MPNNYVLLERTELNASATSVTFANIPQTGYTDLKIVVSGRTSGTDSPVKIEFNGVTTGYSWRRIYGNGSSASSLSGTDAYSLHVDTSSMTANTFSNSEIYIPNYRSSNQKSFSVDTALETNGTAGELFMLACLSTTTAAITSITLTHLNTTLVANSTFSLYGVAALGTTPTVAPKASGGNIIDYDGTYWIHTFTSSGIFTPQTGLICDYLVVAGGGGASAADIGGGGGGGGFKTGSGLSVTSLTSLAVTVGAGGNGAVTPGTNGSNSVFSSITSTGGGYGGQRGGAFQPGGAGGSGGGGGTDGTVGVISAGGAASPSGQGNAGGSGYGGGATTSGGGGGGGAGAAGTNGGNGVAGAGGNGLANTLTGTSITYAGGGGGGSNYLSGAAGGTGGGGNGASGATIAQNGTANRGGGGGGGGSVTNSYLGGNGGSGIVIIRYPAA
jgi:hypothetical protein